MGVLAQWRDRGGDDALRYVLVGDAGDIVNPHAALALGDVEVLAAQLDALRRGRAVPVGFGQPAAIVEMRLVVIGIGVFVQVAADHRLRLVPFGDAHRLDVALLADPGVVANEIDEIGPEQQQLRHDRVVVVFFGDVAVGAGLGLGAPLGVGIMRRESLARIAGGRNRRLLHIDVVAVDVGRRKHQCRARGDRRNDIAFDRAVQPELEHVLARDLRVVGRKVAGLAALVMMPRGLLVCFDRQMAAAAARRPRGMAGVARHLVVGVGQAGRRNTRAPLHRGARRHQLGARRPRVVFGIRGVDRVLDERHFPFEAGVERRALIELGTAPFEAGPAVGGAQHGEVGAAGRRRRPVGAQVGQCSRGAVAVGAGDLDRRLHLAIDMAVAVSVIGEMAVDAMHAEIDMDRVEMHRLLEFLRVVGRDDVVGVVEQVALAVAFVDGAEIPAVSVVVGELGVLELRVELADLGAEFGIGPFAANHRPLGIAFECRAHLVAGRVFLPLRPHLRCRGLVIPHRVAEHAVQKQIRLMHVADHALACRDRGGHDMAQRMSGLAFADGRVDAEAGAAVAERGIGAALLDVAVVGVDDMAGGAARIAVVAGVVVGAEEPGCRDR